MTLLWHNQRACRGRLAHPSTHERQHPFFYHLPPVSVPLLIFATPPPVRSEEPLTSGYRNIPPVFAGIDTYHAIQATVTFTDRVGTAATRPLDAIGAVVQILRCDGFGCDTPVGSGVIIHPSGLILTAYHILLENPNDLRSVEYQDFVIALPENVRTPPRPLYCAAVVADKNEQDIALLAIDRTFDGEFLDGEVIAPGTLALPALPFAAVDLLFADTLTVLGYPLDGGDAVSNFQATFTSFDDNGQLIVVDRPLRQGNSGGPALAFQDGRMAIAGLVIRGRSTQGHLEAEGLLRAIDQVANLNWTTDFARAMGQQINIVERTADGEQQLQLSLDLSTFDLVDANLRLLFYVTDETGQPWQLPGTEGPLVLWANVRPGQVNETQTIHLTVPLAELGTSPNRLRFHGLLWDRGNLLPLWAGTAGAQLDAALVLQTTTAPLATVPATPTPQPTINQPATAAAVENAVAATVDLVAARLTEIAMTTATARALVPTPTPRPTATADAEATITTAAKHEATVAAASLATQSTLIATLPPTDVPTVAATPATVEERFVTISWQYGLNARSNPSTDGDVLQILEQGGEYLVVDSTAEWLEVVLPSGQLAWILWDPAYVTVRTEEMEMIRANQLRAQLNAPLLE